MTELRAICETDDTYDDPSEDLLFELLADVDRGDYEFLIVERTADPGQQTYIQTIRNPDGTYQVEHRAGDASRHFQTITPDYRTTHELFTAWSFNLEGWNTNHTWTQVQQPG